MHIGTGTLFRIPESLGVGRSLHINLHLPLASCVGEHANTSRCIHMQFPYHPCFFRFTDIKDHLGAISLLDEGKPW